VQTYRWEYVFFVLGLVCLGVGWYETGQLRHLSMEPAFVTNAARYGAAAGFAVGGGLCMVASGIVVAFRPTGGGTSSASTPARPEEKSPAT
jgi:hypothetical protein